MAATYKWNFDSNTKKPDPKTMGWLYSRYVLGCPVPKVSARGRTFEALGWKGSAFLTLNAQLKKQSDLTNSRWAWLRDDKMSFLSESGPKESIGLIRLSMNLPITPRAASQKSKVCFT